MMFGDKAFFAIESEITDIHESFYYCAFRFYVKGVMIGDYTEQVTLGVCLKAAEIFLDCKTKRLIPKVESLNAGEIFSEYFESYFKAPYSRKELVEYSYSARFHMQDIGAESTRDNYCILLVRQNDGRERIVIKTKESWVLNEPELLEVYFPHDTIDKVVEAFFNWGIQQGRKAQ